MRGSGREQKAEGSGPGQGIQPTADGPAAFGKYQLFASLGRGGMADVFLAVARGPMGFNKLAVVKRLRPALAEEPSFLTMFLDEARLAARLNHPNVVHTYEVGEHEGQYFIAMEYLEGQSLNKVIRELGKTDALLAPVMCARIVADALAGLHHAHELRDYDGTPLKIIHRDVSPHNVFVTYDGLVKLVDFGIAKAALSQTQTEVGVLKGKVAYMAPEQAMGSPIDRRADLFAMGIVLWELLTQKRLMVADTAAATLHRLLNKPIPRASSVLPSLDPKLDAILAKALEKEPEDRFQTALEMRDALEAWIVESGEPIRQEAIGARMTSLFEGVRADVKLQIQTHMAIVEKATDSGELAALTAESRRLAGRLRAFGSLPVIGSGSGSGSGVVKLASLDEAAEAEAVLTPSTETRAKLPLLVAVVVAVAIVCALVVTKCVRTSRTDAVADMSGAASAPLADTTRPPATTPATSPVSATASEAPAASADDTPPLASGSATATAAKRPAWMLVDAGALSPAPHGTTPPAPSTAPTTATTAGDPPPSPLPGYLTLDTVPWTQVSENGRSLGPTPVIGVALSPGPHTFALDNAAEGIHTGVSVNITSGEHTSRRVVLKQPPPAATPAQQ